MIRFRRFAVAAALGAFVYPLAAQQLPSGPGQIVDEVAPEEALRRYSVEVIIFEYASNVGSGNEIFEPERPASDATQVAGPIDGVSNEIGPVVGLDGSQPDADGADETLPTFGDTIDAVSLDAPLEVLPTRTAIHYEPLPPDQFSMTDIHERLNRLDAYQPVLWGGWIQSVGELESTPAIRLRALGPLPLGMDGELTLYLKNYLHLIVDVTMQQRIATVEPVYIQQRPDTVSGSEPTYDTGIAQTINYRIHEDRIFNDGHLRYFDHPKFGALIRVFRVEDVPGDETDETDPLSDNREMLGAR